MPQRSPVSKQKKKWSVPVFDSTTEELFSGSFNIKYLDTIGSGYTSTVIKCVMAGDSNHSDLETAAKVMMKGGVKKRYFQNEVELLRRSDNFNVVEYIMAFETLDSYVIITEYCGQGDLHGKLKELDDGYVMAREYMIGVTNGLEALHHRLIAHLDIKMKNILITGTNVAKIADFGFAKRFRSKEDTLDVCNGTKDYWAPEMVDSNAGYNPFWADIYALGVTFVGVCVKKPVKKKYDSITMIINGFADRQHRTLCKGMLNTSTQGRWSLDKIKNSSWLYECITPPPSPV